MRSVRSIAMIFLSLLMLPAFAAAQDDAGNVRISFSVKPYPVLRGELRFRDVSENGILEAGERGHILLTIANQGNGKAGSTLVSLVPAAVPYGVHIEEIPAFHGIDAGGSITLEIPVQASDDAQSGDMRFHAEIRDSSGILLVQTDPCVFAVRQQARPGRAPLDRRPPRVRLYAFDDEQAIVTSDSLGEVILTTASKLTIRGEASDSSGVAIVYVNGLEAQPTLRPGGLGFEKDVLLTFGDNLIEIEALDPYENAGIETIRIRRMPEDGGSAVPKEMQQLRNQVFAVVIGISDYEHQGITQLQYADDDAQSFADYLQRPIARGGRGVPRENILLLRNEEATYRQIRYALFEFSKRTVRDDIFIIFFAGHGTSDPLRRDLYYFLPYDSDPISLGSTALPQADINFALNNYVGAGKVIGFFDACHGGAVSSSLARRDSEDSVSIGRFLYETASAREGRLLFSASEVYEKSHEAKRWGGGHGVFTWYLIEGIEGAADRDADRFVKLGELVDYVSDRVQRDTENQQHPTAIGNWDRSIPISVVVKAAPPRN